MDKKVILLVSIVFGAIGAYVPILLGDTDPLSGWSILGGLIGGLLGIWVGVKLSKRY